MRLLTINTQQRLLIENRTIPTFIHLVQHSVYIYVCMWERGWFGVSANTEGGRGRAKEGVEGRRERKKERGREGERERERQGESMRTSMHARARESGEWVREEQE